MYMVALKTAITEGLKKTFDGGYIESDFRNLPVGIEYPAKPQQYPGIWVNYNPTGDLKVMGISHLEYETDEGETAARAFTRWKYQGEATFTLVALTSLERDRLYDELLRVMAFGQESASTAEFRDYIADNEFLAIHFDWDEISNKGFAESVGTPWQTDDVIYEAEIGMECFGEFVSDSQDATLIPLAEIRIYQYHDQESGPPEDEDGVWH